MTIDELKLRPEDDADDAAARPEIVVDDRFSGEFPSWLSRWLQCWLLRPWIRLAESANDDWVWRVALPVNLVLFFVLRRLNDALTLLHNPGDEGYGIRALGQGATVAAKAVEQWVTVAGDLARFDVLREGITGARLATAHTVAGASFSVAWPTAFAFVAVWLCRQLQLADRSPRAVPARTMLGVALLFVPLTVLHGLLLNVARFAVIHDWGRAQVAPFLRFLTFLQGPVILGSAVPLLVGLAILQSTPSPRVRGLFRGLGLLRIHLITMLVFGLFLLKVSTKDQAQDVLRSWQQSPRWALWGVVSVTLFAAATGVSADRVLFMSRSERRPPHHWRSLAFAGIALVAIGGVVRYALDAGGVGFVVAGAGMAAIGLLSSLIQGSGTQQAKGSTPVHPTVHTPAEQQGETETWPALAGLLAAAPLVIVGLAVVLALIPELLGAGPHPVLLAALAVLLFGLAPVAYRLCLQLARIPAPLTPTRILTGWLVSLVIVPAAVITLGLGVWIWSNPWRAGWQLGTIAFVNTFLAAVMVLVMLLATLTHHYSPPAALAILGFRRIPAVLLVVIWGAVGVVVEGNSPTHDARVVRGPRHESIDLDRYTNRWITDRPTPPGEATPMVFVSAAGGGIKAAAWTALVVHCAFDAVVGKECSKDERQGAPGSAWHSVFAVSGASGGSVGLASALAEQLGGKQERDWVKNRLGTDLASASIGWQLFEEAPLTLFRARPGGRDRAEILEEAWSKRWRDDRAEAQCPAAGEDDPSQQGMFALFGVRGGGRDECNKQPPLFFPNGTSLLDGCRFNGSVLDTAPPFAGDRNTTDCTRGTDGASAVGAQLAVTRDLTDFLCSDEDLRLSTAAFLSARFPYVSPSGRLTEPANRGRGGDEACSGVPDQAGTVFVGDGGYRDNTGSSTLVELRNRVERLQKERAGACLVPIFLQINSGYENRSAARTSGRLFESIGPLIGGLNVFGTRDVAGPQLARSSFGFYYFEFSLRAHPAVQAPLGWSLSRSATEDIGNQLSIGNKSELNRLRKLLSPEQPCPGTIRGQPGGRTATTSTVNFPLGAS